MRKTSKFAVSAAAAFAALVFTGSALASYAPNVFALSKLHG